VPEVWSNIGLCCFYSSQFDLSLSCLERALQQFSGDADDSETLSDVWFNIGQVSISIGDMNLAYQAFKISISINPNHGESYANLSVLELYQNPPNEEASQSNRAIAAKLCPHLFEPHYNGALLSFKQGKFSRAYSMVGSALGVNPVHSQSLELLQMLDQVVTVL
jgi:tetratricopeptide repeat protein 8